jgi:hypothetical protein
MCQGRLRGKMRIGNDFMPGLGAACRPGVSGCGTHASQDRIELGGAVVAPTGHPHRHPVTPERKRGGKPETPSARVRGQPRALGEAKRSGFALATRLLIPLRAQPVLP